MELLVALSKPVAAMVGIAVHQLGAVNFTSADRSLTLLIMTESSKHYLNFAHVASDPPVVAALMDHPLNKFLDFCFPCSLLFCFLLFYFSLLLCFYSSLLLCLVLPLCFSAFLIFPAFLLFKLLCCFASAFPCFFAYLFFCFSAFLLFPLFLFLIPQIYNPSQTSYILIYRNNL